MSDDATRTFRTLEELEELVREQAPVYLRYSRGYDADSNSQSKDTESGLSLPGLSVNPLTPEGWWTRPLADWLARQICQYKHLYEQKERHAWVLTGNCVARGPDCEPLLVDVKPLGTLDHDLLKEAERIYQERFDAGNGP